MRNKIALIILFIFPSLYGQTQTIYTGEQFSWTYGERKITITGKGLGLTDHNVSGLEPIEAVFEELNWQIKSAIVTVVNSE